jgi:hypothetical protein
VFDDVLVEIERRGPGADDIGPFGRAAGAGDTGVARGPHFRRDHGNERSAGFEGVQVVNGHPDSLIRQMLLFGRDVLLLDADFLEAADGDEGFAHPVLHPFHQRAHGHEAGYAEDDAKHREHRTELVRPDFLEADGDGVEQVHRWPFSSSPWPTAGRARQLLIHLFGDFAIADFDSARRDRGDLRIVGDERDGAALLA